MTARIGRVYSRNAQPQGAERVATDRLRARLRQGLATAIVIFAWSAAAAGLLLIFASIF